jgi:hypothetical protein
MTKQYLKKIIKEEYKKLLKEGFSSKMEFGNYEDVQIAHAELDKNNISNYDIDELVFTFYNSKQMDKAEGILEDEGIYFDVD